MRTILPLLCLALLVFAVTTVPGASDHAGQSVYAKSCAACHDSGVMGAPKLVTRTSGYRWIAKGVDVLSQNAIKGIGKMPPKGGNMKLSDDDVKAAVA